MPIRNRLRSLAPWGAVFVTALAVRLAYLWSWRETLLFSTPIGDASAYLAWARELAAGDWLGREVFYQAPLYPYFLGVLHTLLGDGLWTVRIAQATIGALACALLGLAGERFFGRSAGVVAGFGLALYAPAIYFDGLIQKTSLDALFLSLLLLAFATLVDRDRPWLAFGSGAVLGLLALVRENALVLAPLAAVFVVISGPPRPALRRALALGALALGLALPLLPVGLRNQAIGGRFLVTTSQLGPNLWIGNHAGASGRYEPLRPGRGNPRFERDDARALAERALGRALSPGEVSDYHRDRALAFMREQPADWLRLLALKWALVWNARELPDTEGIDAYTASSPVLRVLHGLFGFGLLAPLALAGIAATRADWRRLWVLHVSILLLAGSVALFYVFARYRYTLAPVLMLFASAGAVALVDVLRARKLRRLLELGGVACLMALFVHWRLVTTADLALTHYTIGSQLLENGRPREALPELERAIAANGDFMPARIRLADALRDAGEPARALAVYDAVIARAPQLADTHVGRGLALLALGRQPEAVAAYERALALDPYQPDAHNNLGNVLVQQFRSADAIAHYRAALAERPETADFHANLGSGLLQARELPEALAEVDRALALQPGHPTARVLRAMILEASGRLTEALAAYAEVVRAEAPESPHAGFARARLAQLSGPR